MPAAIRFFIAAVLSIMLGASLLTALGSPKGSGETTGDICLTSAQTWPLRAEFDDKGGPPHPGLTPDGPAASKSVSVPRSPVRTGLILVHVLGLALGLGAALFMDLWLASRLYRIPFAQTDQAMLDFGSKLVTGGLALLWVSGLGFLLYYYDAAPAALANGKIWGKVAIVTLLSLNGMFIHRVVLPSLSARSGRPLLEGASLATAAPMIGSAAISVSGWTTAAVLGLVKWFNFAFSASEFVLAYATILLLFFISGLIFHRTMTVDETKYRRAQGPSTVNRLA